MINIRLSNEHDIEVIVEFQERMALETEGITLDRDVVVDGVASVIRDPQKGKYYIAIQDDIIVACLLITHEWSDWRNSWVYWIQSVYVLPNKRGAGIFKKMYDYIAEIVKNSSEVSGIRLYVDVRNTNAQNVYKKIGMNGEHYRMYEWMK